MTDDNATAATSGDQPTSPLAPLPEIDERAVWVRRYHATRMSLPAHADQVPARTILLSNVSGTFEVYAWDRDTDELRQATDRPNGTSDAAIHPSGGWLCWFSDTDGDEYGVWMRQPYAGGADVPLVSGLEPSYPSGLAFADDGTVAIGRTTDDGSSVHVARPAGDGAPGKPVTVYAHEQQSYAGDLSADGTLLAIGHSEHGDSRHPALRVLRLPTDLDAADLDATGPEAVAELWDGEGKGVEAGEFAPLPGDARLLVTHERRGRPELLIWDVTTGEQRELDLDLPGEVGAEWYPDGRALLIHHSHQARSELYRYDLDSGALERLDTPAGTIGSATVRPDAGVEFSWSSAERPSVIRSAAGDVVLTPPGERPAPSVAVTDAWVDGPGGAVHALVSRPSTGSAPYPTVFDIHGGPEVHDQDAFSAETAAWVDHGYAVVRLNYRGSSGYGSAWRDAIEHRVGLTETEDIAAVRDWAVDSGLADPDRLILTGGSWGGYLTLLGLGTRPELWTLGIAAVPVADYFAAFADEMEGLQAYDRALFGGTPEEVPERYRASSPLTYVDQVRAPVLVLAGENDPRCPIRQIDNYLERLVERGHPHEVYRYDAGHGSLVVTERVNQLAVSLDFAARHLPPASG